MKLIITGGSGFVGRNLASAFKQEGAKVIITGRSETKGNELSANGIDFRKVELLDAETVQNSLEPADCIIHCAARCGDWGSYDDFYQANVIGTRNVISACKKHGIKKIIFLSTPNIYFTGEDRLNITEDEQLPEKQATFYGKTKLIAEQELFELTKEGFQVIVLRPRAVYGPHDNTILPRILRMAKQKQFPLINGGQALIDITCIDNLIEAVKKCVNASDDAWNEVYNISDGNPVTVREWFGTVLKIFEIPFRPKSIPLPVAKIAATISEFICKLPFGPQKPQITRFSVGYMGKSMTMSIDKARAKLGYVPVVTCREGFEKMAEWHKNKIQ